MEFNETVKLRRVYQDTRNTSPIWRQKNRIWHPLTEHQFGNRFGMADRVTMRVLSPIKKMFINCTIVNIIPYDIAQQILGSYNIGDTFTGVPFTHVLVLEP
jgi:hypothetical protein